MAIKTLGIVLLLFCVNAACAFDTQPKLNYAKYITMPDGVQIAVEIWLPDGLGMNQKIPAMMSFTRYWRAKEYDKPKSSPPRLARVMNGFGYAYVIADVRGSGASSGVRKTEFSTAEIKDFYHIIDGVIKENWSNGNVGTIGISYLGDTAEMALLSRHPALKVAVPQFTDLDWYTTLLFPGGLKNKIMSEEWGEMVQAMDANDAAALGYPRGDNDTPQVIGVKPVDGDEGEQFLKRAVAEHSDNITMADLFKGVEYRNDLKVANSLDDTDSHSVSLHRFRPDISEANIPSYHWGSWMDAGTAAGMLARFSGDNVSGKYIIGAWGHGARHDADIYNEKQSELGLSLDAQYAKINDFIVPFLLGESSSLKDKELYYYTMGARQWKKTNIWPPKGTTKSRFYFDENRQLSDAPPISRDGSDVYAVDFEAGTGPETRWSTQMGFRDVYYENRIEADKRLMTYTSLPLTRNTEITGHPVITLEVSSSHHDAAVFVYLETVAPDGTVRMITEGQLRLIHRKVSTKKPTYPVFGPYHTFKREDAVEMAPGVVEKVTFSLLPTSVLIPKGHSLRVSIAGHDKDNFYRVPENGRPILKFERSRVRQSYIELPVLQP